MNTEEQNPYKSFKFRVEVEGITVAHVSEVTGLQSETETEPYEEGGVNDFVHILPKRTKHQNITLKRGVADQDDMWRWYQNVVRGDIKRKSGTIFLRDVAGENARDEAYEDKRRWDFFEAYPVKWTGPELKADSNTVAFETIELAHELPHNVKKR